MAFFPGNLQAPLLLEVSLFDGLAASQAEELESRFFAGEVFQH